MGQKAGRTVAIGIQDFGDLIRKGYFYIDKTDFIREWWESGDSVTRIARPRRFGKTLNMSMVEHFFSVDWAKEENLFEGLSIWAHEAYRQIRGTYPVISLSFAGVKEGEYRTARKKICQFLANLYVRYSFLRESDVLTETDRAFFDRVLAVDMDDSDASLALYQLSNYLYRYYGKKVIILLDEYDTPMQEAYVGGYWEVFAALEECGLADKMKQVRYWYDGFIFGSHGDMYNPWSILNFLDTGVLAAYWANTSSNSLVGKLIREGSRRVKEDFERLLRGEVLRTHIDEQIVYKQLDGNEEAIWSLLLASGYLKVLSYEQIEFLEFEREPLYDLTLTNYEVKHMFCTMVQGWFAESKADYNDFIRAMLQDDVDAMNEYMNRVAFSTFSYFDTGKNAYKEEPERFYHGFVLGLMVDLQDRYIITSNRESGFGRYDVMLEPREPQKDDAIILEFKVFNPRRESGLEDTVAAAHRQIEEKQYAAGLMAKGIEKARIRSYGFAFEGKTVLIG